MGLTGPRGEQGQSGINGTDGIDGPEIFRVKTKPSDDLGKHKDWCFNDLGEIYFKSMSRVEVPEVGISISSPDVFESS